MTNIHNCIWMPIPEFEGIYEASNLGLIKTLSRDLYHNQVGREGILRPKFDEDCYLSVSLNKGGKKHYFRINRIIAQVFIPNPENKPVTDHINGIRWDNRVENLRWATISENTQSAFDFGRKRPPGRVIECVTLDGIVVKRYEKMVHIEQDGFLSKGIKRYIIGGYPYKGFKWRYADK